jgi:serine phosphatase RsbU (regulator of sigma subunit)
LTIAVLLVGLVTTAALSWVSYTVNSHNESRLLDLQARQTGTLLQVVIPSIQTPLASATALASTSDGNPASFRTYISTYVGQQGPFTSVSLWNLTGPTPSLVTVVGSTPVLESVPGRAASFLAGTRRSPGLSVVGPLGTTAPRVGFAYLPTGQPASYAVYAESMLPANRRVAAIAGTPYADLRFALYLGRTTNAQALLETNAPHLPMTGRIATVVVPFGTGSLTLVASSASDLGGTLSAARWWIIALIGVLVAAGAAVMTERLVRRRTAAEHLTYEVQHLLAEQRSIAESLQQALLPKTMPDIAGMQLAARYIPGANGVDIGGDWYDIVPVDDRRFFFVVGDVSGRGVSAGTIMAALHFAIRGFISEGHPPGKILDTLSRLLSISRDKHFATVLCGLADIDRHEITIANAGHLPPLLIGDGVSSFVSTQVGPPIGIDNDGPYQSVTIKVAPRTTMLAYTDGLVERSGEPLDVGLARLKNFAITDGESLDALLSTIVTELEHDGHNDDTAILGVRWLG